MAELNFNVNLGGDEPAKNNFAYAPSIGTNATASHKDTGNQGSVTLNINPSAAAENPQQQQSQSKVPLCGFFTVEYYQPYFNLTTKDVHERIKSSLNPIKPRFFELTRENPDLYGPIWIYTTLVLVLAAAGNFAQYLNSSGKTVSYNYNFVPTAALLVYGYGFVFPIILTIILKVFGSNTISFIQTICCYGYSLFVFIPASVLAIIPVSILQWILFIAAIVSSTFFLITNYGHELGKYVGKQRYILIGFIGAAQIVLLLIFKLYFFYPIYNDKPIDNKADLTL